MKKRIKAANNIKYYNTNPSRDIPEEEMYDDMVGYLLDSISGDYGDVDIKQACNEYLVWVQELLDKAVEEIESGKAKSIYDR